LERWEAVIMPSSDPVTIPKVLQLVQTLSPKSILDIGTGNGRYGFLFREILDFNYGRFSNWEIRIDGVEVEKDYISPVHRYVYDNLYVGDWLNLEIDSLYDVVFMGDVLEHFKEWNRALMKARRIGKTTIIVCPNWSGSIQQGEWEGYLHESHQVELSPSIVGGRCLFANSKCFMSVFGDRESVTEGRDILI
jgi:SAM-dependent methyltransferase